ncbi:MAG: c-type cytochrome [Pseudohongiellaceae bacterium]
MRWIPTASSHRARAASCPSGTGRSRHEQSILEERSNLTPEYLKAVVHNGIGSMPRFSRGELTDAELQQLISYLVP